MDDPRDGRVGLARAGPGADDRDLARGGLRQQVIDDGRLRFVEGDICDAEMVEPLAKETEATVNFAAESHVDRSLLRADAFVKTDVEGTYVLLEAARRHGHRRFVQVSTDEVYGHVPTGRSKEDDPLRPRSPYSATKAGAEMLVGAYRASYNLETLITRGSNTYGPYQFPEKIIPLFITNALENRPLPIYGDGSAVRDYLYVDDHAAAIGLVLQIGKPGESYNIGAGMTRVRTAAEFISRNMPFDAPGTLTDRQAFDVAAYVNAHPRPDFRGKENDWPNGNPPPDVAYPTRSHH